MDRSSAGSAAVAKVLGEIERAALHILHVGEHKPAGESCSVRLGRFMAPALDGLTIETRVGDASSGNSAGRIERSKPRLIVMCKHSGAERGKMLGRTAMKVLHDAPCPMVLVPPERGATPWHLHHVLVPHDGTPRPAPHCNLRQSLPNAVAPNCW